MNFPLKSSIWIYSEYDNKYPEINEIVLCKYWGNIIKAKYIGNKKVKIIAYHHEIGKIFHCHTWIKISSEFKRKEINKKLRKIRLLEK